MLKAFYFYKDETKSLQCTSIFHINIKKIFQNEMALNFSKMGILYLICFIRAILMGNKH